MNTEPQKEGWEERFENTFAANIRGIVEGRGKEMKIRRQVEYKPLTVENVKSFICELLDEEKLTSYNQGKEDMRREIELKIPESVERVIIDYANMSGREDTLRAPLRLSITKHLAKLLSPDTHEKEC